jgi:hypothetical protein
MEPGSIRDARLLSRLMPPTMLHTGMPGCPGDHTQLTANGLLYIVAIMI